MADTFLEQKELMPKDILRFLETRAERALEVLREIIDMPEYDNAQLAQAIAAAPNQVWTLGQAGTAWGTGAATSLGTITGTPLAGLNTNVQGGFNG